MGSRVVCVDQLGCLAIRIRILNADETYWVGYCMI